MQGWWAAVRYAAGKQEQVNPHQRVEGPQIGRQMDSAHSAGTAEEDKEIEFGRVGEKRQVVADTSLVLGAERKVVEAERRAEIDTIALLVGFHKLIAVGHTQTVEQSRVQAVQENTREVDRRSRWLEEPYTAVGIDCMAQNRSVL